LVQEATYQQRQIIDQEINEYLQKPVEKVIMLALKSMNKVTSTLTTLSMFGVLVYLSILVDDIILMILFASFFSAVFVFIIPIIFYMKASKWFNTQTGNSKLLRLFSMNIVVGVFF
jgi:hypothetical protein